jgi:hypothetical protein
MKAMDLNSQTKGIKKKEGVSQVKRWRKYIKKTEAHASIFFFLQQQKKELY